MTLSSQWISLLHRSWLGPPKRGRPRKVAGFYGCGHPKTPENSIGHVQRRCRICKRESSERERLANPGYFERYRREHRQYFIDYGRAYRGAKVTK